MGVIIARGYTLRGAVPMDNIAATHAPGMRGASSAPAETPVFDGENGAFVVIALLVGAALAVLVAGCCVRAACKRRPSERAPRKPDEEAVVASGGEA